MGAIRSAAMVKALKLILEKGYSAAEAARKTGLTRGAISQTAEYKEMRAKRAQPQTGEK